MKNWVFTGVSGCGRSELVEELSAEIRGRGKTVNTFDVGKYLYTAAKELKIDITDQKVLDLDQNMLFALRKLALNKILNQINKEEADFNFIGIHVTFRWRQRLIKVLTYRDLLDFDISGFINVVDDVEKIVEVNSKNPKWSDVSYPDPDETNNWLMEEEFVTEILADVLNVPLYIAGRQHNIYNLADLFLTNKPKFYLSYPITHIEKDQPELLKQVRNDILPKLEEQFIIFDPLVIKDMNLTYDAKTSFPNLLEELSENAINSLKSRTIERDFQFIDQSDFIVVIYLTEKLSPGVLSEIIYANNRNKPVYMVFPYTKSPFLELYATNIFNSLEELLEFLHSEEFRREPL